MAVNLVARRSFLSLNLHIHGHTHTPNLIEIKLKYIKFDLIRSEIHLTTG